jgi:hypothetical protein
MLACPRLTRAAAQPVRWVGAGGLLQENMPLRKPVRLLGVSLSSCKPGKAPSPNWISDFDPD